MAPSDSVTFDFGGQVAVVTGASGALGSGVAAAFADAGATVACVDVQPPDADDAQGDLAVDDRERCRFYQADLTDENDVERVVGEIVDDHDRIDALCNIAGTWKGGDPIDETEVSTFDLVFDVNLRTMFLASKHCLPHLRETESESGTESGTGGAIVSVSAKSSLEGGEGDGPYRAAKAGVRLLTESIAAENRGEVRANAVMPKVIDTPMNREMMPDADHDAWPTPGEIADVFLLLCSDAAGVTSGAAVPVYGDA